MGWAVRPRLMRSRVLVRFVAPSAVALTALLAVAGSPDSTDPADHAGHAAHEIAVPAAAYVPMSHALSRSGWTVTTAAHEVTVDLHAATQVSALHYLPPQGGSPAERTTRFRVSLSTDAAHWTTAASGTWAPDPTEQVAEFTTASARYVRLTALDDTNPSASSVSLYGATPDSAPPTLILDHSTWTASASDYEDSATEVDVPYNVLDDDPYTIWSSSFSGTPKPFPHYITIDMKATHSISGISYLTREGGGKGTIGDYSVTLSTDGTHFTAPVAQGTWADTTSLKYAYFTKQTARYVRLTATSEAGNRGPFTVAAEINVLAPLNPAVSGQWGPVIGFPIVPVSTVLLPHHKLLTFSAYTADAYTTTGAGYTQTAILNLDTGVVSQRQISNTGHEMFCTGLALLPDGRVLVNGGSDSGKTSIYDPATDTWSAGPLMNIPRGYESSVTLSNGKVFTLGGSWSGGARRQDGRGLHAGRQLAAAAEGDTGLDADRRPGGNLPPGQPRLVLRRHRRHRLPGRAEPPDQLVRHDRRRPASTTRAPARRSAGLDERRRRDVRRGQDPHPRRRDGLQRRGRDPAGVRDRHQCRAVSTSRP